MTREEALEAARRGDVAALRERHTEVAAAIESFAGAGDGASALELFARAWRTWLSEDALEEGAAAGAAALSARGAEDASQWRVRALYGDGVLAFRSGDRDRSLARNDEALALARRAKDVQGECEALTGLARVALRDGDFRKVVALASSGRELARQAGLREAEASPLHLLAAGVRLQGDHHRARELYLESLDLNTALGNESWIAMEQHNLGWVELHLGDADAAEKRFDACAGTGEGDAYRSAWDALNRAGVSTVRGRLDEAAASFEAGKRMLEAMHSKPDPDDQAELEWLAGRLGRR